MKVDYDKRVSFTSIHQNDARRCNKRRELVGRGAYMIAHVLLLQPVVLREWAAAGIFILERENSQKLHTPRKR